MNKLIQTIVMASVATVGVTATPAMAQRYYDDRASSYDYRSDRRDYGYDRGYQQRGYDQGYDQRGNNDDRRAYRQDYRRTQRCRGSGTTGTILGAIAGGLLGREIGRGGYRNRPSTTGLIVGAGAGALAGRAIDRGGCR